MARTGGRGEEGRARRGGESVARREVEDRDEDDRSQCSEDEFQ